MTASRDGGLQNLEVHGMMTLRINDESKGRVKVLLHQGDMKNIQLQVGVWRDANAYNCQSSHPSENSGKSRRLSAKIRENIFK